MQASISLHDSPELRYVLRLADTCLILAQRLGQWCGHAPVLEEDIALTNMALDLIGQARALYTHAGDLHATLNGVRYDEDQLAFLRDERDYLNPTLVELPNALDGSAAPGDFAQTVLRNCMIASLLVLVWTALLRSNDKALAAIAEKAIKEARYHQQHYADWVVRLGDGTVVSAKRMQHALGLLWPYVSELFIEDAIDRAAATQGLGPAWSTLRASWMSQMQAVLEAAQLQAPELNAFCSTGRRGVHSEHMGFLLAEMQHLQRTYPGAVW